MPKTPQQKVEPLFDITAPPKKPPRDILIKYEDLYLPAEEPVNEGWARELARLIHFWGWIDPLLVEKEADGRYRVHGGRHRFTAVGYLRDGGLNVHNGERAYELEPQPTRFAKIPCLPLNDLPGGKKSGAAITLLENNARKINPVAELDALLLLQKGDNDGNPLDEKSIYRLTGMRAGKQRRLSKLSGLIPELMTALHDGTITFGRAHHLCEKSSQKQLAVWNNFKARAAADESVKTISDEDIEPVMRVQIQQAFDSMPAIAFEPLEVPVDTSLERLLTIVRKVASTGVTSSPDNERKNIWLGSGDWAEFLEAVSAYEKK